MAFPRPPRLIGSDRPLANESLEAIAVPVLADGEVPAQALAALAPLTGVAEIAHRLAAPEPGWSSWVSGEPDAPDLLLVGIGPAGEDGAGLDGLREAAMVAGRGIGRRRVASLLATARAGDAEAATVVAEGWSMGAYRFDRYRGEPPAAATEEVLMWACEPRAVAVGAILAEATGTARDLVNTPGGELPPSALAEACCELGSEHGFEVRVRGAEELREGRFGGLLAVGAGSAAEPLLIELRRGDPEQAHVALVGKGITFDSGGLSLKSSAGMLTMKGDMAGAASIVGALIAADRLGLERHVRAYLPCAENMPGGAALRVGDVIRHRNGITTEVADTDCEGRLVLADALAYAAESRPTELIDLATLSSHTGVGPELWAVLGTAPAACEGLMRAGAASGEPGWQLPLWDGYLPRLRSQIADLKNYDPASGPSFGAVFAGLYLRHFVGTTPWAHIDLGVTNMRAEPNRAWSGGANGVGTRTLARYLGATATSRQLSGQAHQPPPETSSPDTRPGQSAP